MSYDSQEFKDDSELDSVDGPCSTLSTSSFTVEQAQECIVKLESAIQSGNVDVATEMAELLAKVHTAVRVKADTSCLQDYISITIRVVDKTDQKETFVWTLQPSISIYALRWKMFERYGFSPIQKWIIGNRVAVDTDSLAGCGVKTTGTAIFLYLLTPTTVHKPSRHEAISNDYNHQLSSSDQTVFNSSTLSEERLLHVTIPHTPSDSNLSLKQPSPTPTLKSSTSSPVSTDVQRPQQQVGWQCPKCTYINEATRPGCELCATDRPEDYQPPAGYQPSARERRRLEEEKRLEELIAAETRQLRLDDTMEGQENDELFNEQHVSIEETQLLREMLGRRPLSDEEMANHLQQQEIMFAGLSTVGRLETDIAYDRRYQHQ